MLKSHAHVLQWSEELQLVEEEMRRVQVSLTQKVDWWEERCGGWQPPTPQFLEGIAAYADKQAALIRRLVMSFSMLWGAQGDLTRMSGSMRKMLRVTCQLSCPRKCMNLIRCPMW